jgi:outer membrane protein OmpA-like peptidoglycan-associated protein
MRSVNASTWPISQLEFGRQASYARCLPPVYPTATPKTLALEPEPEPAHRMILPACAIASQGAGEGLALATRNMVPTAPPVAKEIAAQPDEPSPEQVVVLFAFGDATLNAAARALIDQLAKPLASARRIAVSGRTDNVGPQQTNQWLATARANAVRDHLRTRYPHLAAAVELDAQGACCFAASNETPQGRAMNRRVEVFVERHAENQ